jgi:hypothetical protein
VAVALTHRRSPKPTAQRELASADNCFNVFTLELLPR